MHKTTDLKNVALIEFGKSHSECLHTQIYFMAKAGYCVHLICDSVVWSQIEEKEKLAGSMSVEIKRGFFQSLLVVFKARRYMRKHRITHLVVNTIENAIIRILFLLPFFRKVNCTGLVHESKKFASGHSFRRIIRHRVKKFFVLSEYIKNTTQDVAAKGKYEVEFFYPLYFPALNDISLVKKNDGEFWITIPGLVELHRRDYSGLLKAIRREPLHPSVKLILLGNYTPENFPEFQQLLNEAGTESKQLVMFGADFISNDVFHSYIRRSDLILPLMFPIDGNQSIYGEHKISGAFNLSFAYKIPLLLEESMKNLEDFKGCSFYYKANNLVSTINSFVNRQQEIEAMRRNMAADPRYNLEQQMQRYVNFVQL